MDDSEYVCPQCGPDSDGAEAHQRKAHLFFPSISEDPPSADEIATAVVAKLYTIPGDLWDMVQRGTVMMHLYPNPKFPYVDARLEFHLYDNCCIIRILDTGRNMIAEFVFGKGESRPTGNDYSAVPGQR